MEIGQILHHNPVNRDCPHFVRALLSEIRSELARVYWNVNQEPWAGAGFGDVGGEVANDIMESLELKHNPLPPGVEWRPYYNWSGSPDDDDWDQDEADKPNFSFGEVEVRWYKHFGRSMNVNVDWSPEQWVHWFDQCLSTIWEYEKKEAPWVTR